MPLLSGKSKGTIKKNIVELLYSFKQKGTIGTSKPSSMKKATKQAVAIAYSKARQSKSKK